MIPADFRTFIIYPSYSYFSSYLATQPIVEEKPFISTVSLMLIGTPNSGENSYFPKSREIEFFHPVYFLLISHSSAIFKAALKF